MATAGTLSQVKGGFFGYAVFALSVALYVFSGFCGVRTIQRAHGWLRLNQVLWAAQVPVLLSPVISFAFASGATLTAWAQFYPQLRFGWNAGLGSSHTIQLLTPGHFGIGINLVALGISIYLARLVRSDA